MRTPILYVIMLFCLQPSLFSQDFAPLNATWYYQDFSFACIKDNYIKLAVEKDTVIENKYVTILELYYNDIHQPEGQLLIHEENRQVFFYEENEFKLFYDFNLQAGDTAVVNIPKNRTHFDFSCNNGEFSLPNYKALLIVDSTSTINIQGEVLKVLHTPYEYETELHNCFSFGTITERLGPEYGLSGRHCIQCLAECTGYLRCYADEKIDIHPATEDCDARMLTSTNNLSQANIKLFPNPVIETLYIESTEKMASFILFDITGKQIRQGLLNNNSLSFSGLEAGVYLVSLKHENGQQQVTYKVIKR